MSIWRFNIYSKSLEIRRGSSWKYFVSLHILSVPIINIVRFLFLKCALFISILFNNLLCTFVGKSFSSSRMENQHLKFLIILISIAIDTLYIPKILIFISDICSFINHIKTNWHEVSHQTIVEVRKGLIFVGLGIQAEIHIFEHFSSNYQCIIFLKSIMTLQQSISLNCHSLAD